MTYRTYEIDVAGTAVIKRKCFVKANSPVEAVNAVRDQAFGNSEDFWASADGSDMRVEEIRLNNG